MLTAMDETAKVIKRWYYVASHWPLGDVMVGNITFYDFYRFLSIAGNTVDKLQF